MTKRSPTKEGRAMPLPVTWRGLLVTCGACLLLELSVAQKQSWAGTSEIIAKSGSLRVELSSQGGRYRLKVRHLNKGVIWQTQPSSSLVKVSFGLNRLVIFSKVLNPGVFEFDRSSPVRGAVMYTPTGVRISALPDIYDGGFFGSAFVGKKFGGGLVAFDGETGAQIWSALGRLRGISLAPAASGLLTVRGVVGDERIRNCVLDASTGAVLFKTSDSVDNYARIDFASREQVVKTSCISLRRPGVREWRSRIITPSGKVKGLILWPGEPRSVAVSASGSIVAAVCFTPPTKGEPGSITAVAFSADGNRLATQRLETVPEGQTAEWNGVEYEISFRSGVVNVKMIKVFPPIVLEGQQ